jgi:hypothetical protein
MTLTMNDEFGDPLRATHEKAFKMNTDVLKITMPFRMQLSGPTGEQQPPRK